MAFMILSRNSTNTTSNNIIRHSYHLHTFSYLPFLNFEFSKETNKFRNHYLSYRANSSLQMVYGNFQMASVSFTFLLYIYLLIKTIFNHRDEISCLNKSKSQIMIILLSFAILITILRSFKYNKFLFLNNVLEQILQNVIISIYG